MPSSEKGGINGYHVNGAINDTESVDSLSEGMETLSIDARELEDPESTTPDVLDRTGEFINRSLKSCFLLKNIGASWLKKQSIN